jgi:hypothetical protein
VRERSAPGATYSVRDWAPVDSGGGPPPPVLLSRIEHGWLGIAEPMQEQTLPVPVYTASSTRAYYQSAGTQIRAGYQRHLFNRLQVATDLLTLPDDPPTLDSDNAHPSVVHVTAAPAIDRRIWTGAAARLNIALRGAGRAWSAVLPGGWSDDPNTVGLVRDPDGGWWIARASASAGVQCVALAIPAALQDLHTRWMAGDYSGADAAAVEATILSRLTLPPGATVYQAATPAAVAGATADGAAPIRGGWHWYHQAAPEGGQPAGCTQTAIRFVHPDMRARTSSIAITWADGVPSAAVAVGSESRWGGGVIRVPGPTGTVPIDTGATYIGSAVVYSYTARTMTAGATGVCLVTQTHGVTTNDSTAIPQFPVMPGGGGGAGGTRVWASGTRYGVSGPGSISVAPRGYATLDWRTRSATSAASRHSVTGTGEPGPDYEAAAIRTPFECRGQGTYTVELIQVTSTETREVIGGGSQASALTLLDDDPGVILAMKQVATTFYTATDTFEDPTKSWVRLASGCGINETNNVRPGGTSLGPLGGVYNRSNTGVPSNGESAKANYLALASATGSGNAKSPTYTAKAVGSDGIVRTPSDQSVWGALTASSGEVPGPSLMCSGWGAAVHTIDGPSEVWDGGNGLSLAAREHIFGVWAGGVSS